MKDPIQYRKLKAQECEHFEKEGYLIIENLLNKDEVQVIKDDILEVVTEEMDDSVSKLKQTPKYYANSHLDYFINSVNLNKIVSTLMGGPSHFYCPFSAIKSSGGGGEFNFHQDNQYTRLRGKALNMWFAFVDMKIENGCLYIDPASHLNGTLDAEVLEDGHRKTAVKPKNSQPMLIKAGSCVAFDRLTVHGSTFNKSNEHRIAYAVQFFREDTEVYLEEEWKKLIEFPVYHCEPSQRIA